MRPRVIRWDGVHIPEELGNLPPGQYAIEPVDQPPQLTEQEEEGILAALNGLDAGRGVPLAEVVREIRRGFSRQ